MIPVAMILAQTVLTGCLALWMIVAVSGNWLRPALNRETVAMVMRFDLMAQMYPDDYELVKHRRIDNPTTIRRLFSFLVLWETFAALLLALGTCLLAAAGFGAGDPGFARLVALIGTLAFTATWTGFLIGGEYFCYWYNHFSAQVTHMLLAVWGTLVTILLLLPV